MQGDNSPKKKVLEKLTSRSSVTADNKEEENEEEKLVKGMTTKGNLTSVHSLQRRIRHLE